VTRWNSFCNCQSVNSDNHLLESFSINYLCTDFVTSVLLLHQLDSETWLEVVVQAWRTHVQQLSPPRSRDMPPRLEDIYPILQMMATRDPTMVRSDLLTQMIQILGGESIYKIQCQSSLEKFGAELTTPSPGWMDFRSGLGTPSHCTGRATLTALQPRPPSIIHHHTLTASFAVEQAAMYSLHFLQIPTSSAF
jgi:hypothetical protein